MEWEPLVYEHIEEYHNMFFTYQMRKKINKKEKE